MRVAGEDLVIKKESESLTDCKLQIKRFSSAPFLAAEKISQVESGGPDSFVSHTFYRLVHEGTGTEALTPR